MTEGIKRSRSKAKVEELLLQACAALLILLLGLHLPRTVSAAHKCFNLKVLSCGGNGSAVPADRCYPTVTRLSATIIDIDSLGGGQLRLYFNVTCGGRGWHVSNANPFRVGVRARVDNFGDDGAGGCSSTDIAPPGIGLLCVEVSGSTCYQVTVTSSSQQVKFWAAACQSTNEGAFCTCECETDTVRLFGPWQVGTSAGLGVPSPSELGPPPCEASIGDPINVTNGNLYIERRDGVIAGDLGPQLELSRHFNSRSSDTGALGNSWRFGFEHNLRQDVTGNLIYTEGTGRFIIFRKQTLQQDTVVRIWYSPDYGIDHKLTVDTLAGRYVVQSPDDTRMIFNGLGGVDSIADLNGNAIRMFYTGVVLDSLQHASGRRVIFAYMGGRVSSIRGGTSDTIAKYSYTGSGRLSLVTYADGTLESYSYGNHAYDSTSIDTISGSNGMLRVYSYDTTGQAKSFARAAGNEPVSYTRSTYSFTGCNGGPDTLEIQVRYGSSSSINNRKTAWEEGPERPQIASSGNGECAECAQKYTYDGDGRKRLITYANGRLDSIVHDARGNRVYHSYASNSPYPRREWMKYDSTFNRATHVREVSIAKPGDTAASRFVFDSKGNVTSIIDSGWRDQSKRFKQTTTLTYNSQGQPTKINGPRTDVPNDTIIYKYHANGDLQYEILSNGDTVTHGQRNLLGYKTWTRGPNGDTTRFQFNHRGWLTKLVDGAGYSDSLVTTYTYDVDGHILTTARLAGSSHTNQYDSSGYLRKSIDKLGRYVENTYDSIGEIRTNKLYDATPVMRYSESRLHNDKHQLIEQVRAGSDTSKFGYDVVGNLLFLRNPLGDTTKFRYDSLSRVTVVVEPLTGDSIVTRIQYDARDNVTRITDGTGLIYSYKYDDLDRLVYDSCAVTGITQYGHDSAGNLQWIKNANSDSISHSYDSLNRLIAVRYPDSQNVYYDYDGTEFNYGRGRLYRERTPACTTRYRYDRHGRLYQEIRTFQGHSKTYTTQFAYDRNDRIVSIGYPSNLQIGYAYDSTGNVSTVTLLRNDVFIANLASNITYLPFGPPETWTLGNGITVRNKYSTRYLIDSIHTGNTPVMKWAYTTDKNGNVTEIKDVLTSANTRNFQYDKAERLTQVTCADFPNYNVHKYRYTQNGNRDTFIVSNGILTLPTTYTYSRNRLTSTVAALSSTFYSYDSVGRVTREITGTDTTLYVYSDAGDLTSMTSAGSTKTFAYAGLNRRVKTVLNGAVTRYISNSDGMVYCEYDDTGKILVNYVYLHGRLLAQLYTVPDPACGGGGGGIEEGSMGMSGVGAGTSEAGSGDGGGGPCDSIVNVLYYHLDHLGTPWYMTDKNKTIVWRGEYYPYGELYSETASITNDYRLPGQYDDRTGRPYYNWHRYYNPKIGRYHQPDPAGLTDIANSYAYGRLNPVRYTDPYGLYTFEDFGQDAANALVSFGDNISFGATRWIRAQEWYGGDCFTNQYSVGYGVGTIGATILPFPFGKTSALAKVASLLEMHTHHKIPRQFAREALAAGININDHTRRLPAFLHNRKPFGIHTGADNYNRAWANYFKESNRRTAPQILDQMNALDKRYNSLMGIMKRVLRTLR